MGELSGALTKVGSQRGWGRGLHFYNRPPPTVSGSNQQALENSCKKLGKGSDLTITVAKDTPEPENILRELGKKSGTLKVLFKGQFPHPVSSLFHPIHESTGTIAGGMFARRALGARPARYLSINYPDFSPRSTL